MEGVIHLLLPLILVHPVIVILPTIEHPSITYWLLSPFFGLQRHLVVVSLPFFTIILKKCLYFVSEEEEEVDSDEEEEDGGEEGVGGGLGRGAALLFLQHHLKPAQICFPCFPSHLTLQMLCLSRSLIDFFDFLAGNSLSSHLVLLLIAPILSYLTK